MKYYIHVSEAQQLAFVSFPALVGCYTVDLCCKSPYFGVILGETQPEDDNCRIRFFLAYSGCR